MSKYLVAPLSVLALLLSTNALAQQAPSTIEELWEIIQAQQIEIAELRDEVRQAQTGVTEASTEVAATQEQFQEQFQAQLDATGEFVESMIMDQEESNRVSISGYGELHYNKIDSDNGANDEIDFHRFVLFFGHDFSDRIRFFSEFELEHSLAGDGKPGEVELEQAYIDFGITDNLSVKTGLFLTPVGILNETHEPPTFYGVERNTIENIILPSTWWEAGAALSGRNDNGLSWDLAAHSGLAIPTTGSSAFRVRSGRQKVAEALANDFAYTARLRYSGIPGLDLSASYQYQTDPSQVAGDGLDSGQLFTAHAVYKNGGFGLRALHAAWEFDGAAVELADADSQSGWYIEPSYRFSQNWGIYARYEDVDGARDQDKFTQNEFGFNYWPIDGVVLKMDYRQRDHSLNALSGTDFDALDLGFGYSF